MKTKLLIAVVLVPISGGAFAATVSEPATVFYGKVLNESGPVQHLLTEGELVWTIKGAEGEADITLRTDLAKYGAGGFCYRLDVPHHVLALGLDPASASLPVAAEDASHRHLNIEVNGGAASIKSPGNYKFDIGAARRAATHRLDLIVAVPSEDSDGDGMPDWWEDEQGLDKQSNDSDGDLDGDGISNLHEFLGGSGANHDNRGPELLTTGLFAFSGARSGVLLRTLDIDSAPEQILFTLRAAPGTGILLLRNAQPDPQSPDRELGVGDTFSQADVNGGRLIFRLDDNSADLPATTFSVSVRDEDPQHEPDSGAVEVSIFVPQDGLVTEELITAAPLPDFLPGVGTDEEQLIRSAILGREHDFIIWDFSGGSADHALTQPSTGLPPEDYLEDYVPQFGPAGQQSISGGRGDDDLAGGMSSDLILGGKGDDSLRGSGGSDRFVIRDATEGNDTIVDFVTGPLGDVLDLSRVLDGNSPWLLDYLELRDATDGATLGVDADGDGSGFTDLVVSFAGLHLAGSDLYQLVDDGNLLVGTVQLPPLLEIAASGEGARENGPTSGEFTIVRRGSTDASVEVNLLVLGTATNGVDYSLIPSTVTLPAGESSLVLPVVPFPDSNTEVAEVVEITILEGAGYDLGSAGSAQVFIQDLRPELTVTTLVGLAEANSGQEAIFMLSRGAVLDRNVLVRIEIGGTATAGSDFQFLSPFVEMSAGETFRLIRVVPTSFASLASGAETVTVSLLDDASYVTTAPDEAGAVIVSERTELGAWRDRHFAGNEEELELFAAGDTGGFGIPHLLRYGFRLDPANPHRSPGGLQPELSLVDGHLTLRYRENPAASDLAYALEVSGDLRIWSTAGAADVTEITPLEEEAGIKVYRMNQPATAAPFRSLRVRITREAP